MKSPQINMFWFDFVNVLSTKSQNVSIFEPGVLYIQLTMTFLFFAMQISVYTLNYFVRPCCHFHHHLYLYFLSTNIHSLHSYSSCSFD